MGRNSSLLTHSMQKLGNGLRGLITKIDKDADWVEFVRLCTERSGKIQKTDILAQNNMVVGLTSLERKMSTIY